MTDKIMQYAVDLIERTSNVIQKRMILSYFKKCAKILDDLKNIEQFKKYFVTEEQSKEKLRNFIIQHKKFTAEDVDWYKQTLDTCKFYMYQDPGIGINDVLYAECQMADFLRRGYDDPVCLVALYQADKNGNVSNSLIGYKAIKDKTLYDARDEIKSQGMKGFGRMYLIGNKFYADIEELKTYVEEQLAERNKQLKNVNS